MSLPPNRKPIIDNIPEKLTAHAVRGMRVCSWCNGLGHKDFMIHGETHTKCFLRRNGFGGVLKLPRAERNKFRMCDLPPVLNAAFADAQRSRGETMIAPELLEPSVLEFITEEAEKRKPPLLASAAQCILLVGHVGALQARCDTFAGALALCIDKMEKQPLNERTLGFNRALFEGKAALELLR